jgi:hypothetical protein
MEDWMIDFMFQIIFYLIFIIAILNAYLFFKHDVHDYNKGYKNALKQYASTKHIVPFKYPHNSYEYGFNDACDYIYNFKK